MAEPADSALGDKEKKNKKTAPALERREKNDENTGLSGLGDAASALQFSEG